MIWYVWGANCSRHTIHMGHLEQDGKNLNSMVRIFLEAELIWTKYCINRDGVKFSWHIKGSGRRRVKKTLETKIFKDFFVRFFRDFSTKLKNRPTLGQNMSLNIKLLYFLFHPTKKGFVWTFQNTPNFY